MMGIYCCECGVRTPCKWKALNVGNVMQCPSCKLTAGHVRGNEGGSAWLRLEPGQVAFHRLLETTKGDADDADS